MGQLCDRMQEDLKLGGYSASTCRIYVLYTRMFAKFHMCSPAEMSEPEKRSMIGLATSPCPQVARLGQPTNKCARAQSKRC